MQTGKGDCKQYLDDLWESGDNNLLRLFFGRKLYFLKQVEIELMKLLYPEDFDIENNVRYGQRSVEEMTISEIEEVDPDYAASLKNGAFEKSKDANGNYTCALCGKKGKTRRGFQVDHIIAMNNGGRSVPENLQILCSKCNGIKGSRK